MARPKGAVGPKAIVSAKKLAKIPAMMAKRPLAKVEVAKVFDIHSAGSCFKKKRRPVIFYFWR
jgi:hypothetical protein